MKRRGYDFTAYEDRMKRLQEDTALTTRGHEFTAYEDPMERLQEHTTVTTFEDKTTTIEEWTTSIEDTSIEKRTSGFEEWATLIEKETTSMTKHTNKEEAITNRAPYYRLLVEISIPVTPFDKKYTFSYRLDLTHLLTCSNICVIILLKLLLW